MLSVIDCSRNPPRGHVEVASIAGRYVTFERVSPGEPMVALHARIGHPLRISIRTEPHGFGHGAGGLGTTKASPGRRAFPRLRRCSAQNLLTERVRKPIFKSNRLNALSDGADENTVSMKNQQASGMAMVFQACRRPFRNRPLANRMMLIIQPAIRAPMIPLANQM